MKKFIFLPVKFSFPLNSGEKSVACEEEQVQRLLKSLQSYFAKKFLHEKKNCVRKYRKKHTYLLSNCHMPILRNYYFLQWKMQI